MGDCSDFMLWFPFALGWMLNIIGLSISTAHKRPVLFWISAFAPIIVPVCVFSLILLIASFIDLLGLRHQTNRNQATATVAAVQEQTLQAEPREPPITDGAKSFDIASLPTYLYDKEAVEGGLVCPICKELFAKKDAIIQLPLCIHCFHKECIEAWLRTNLTCPVCRCRVDMELPRDIAINID